MDTSLAPSPIARVIISWSSYLMSLTTSAFWLGDTLQHITASAVFEIFKKVDLKSELFKMMASASASTKRPSIYPYFILSLFFWTISSWQNFETSAKLESLYFCMFSLWRSLQDSPIFSAVSSLSPVSIHILIPASWSEWIVSGTSS